MSIDLEPAVKPANEAYLWSKNRIEPSPMPMSYRAGLLVVAVMMVLLPLLYVALCVSARLGNLYLCHRCDADAGPSPGGPRSFI